MLRRLRSLPRHSFVALICSFAAFGTPNTTAISPPLSAAILLQTDFEASNHDDFAQRLIRDDHIDYVPTGGVGGSGGIRVSYEGYPRGSRRVIVGYPLSHQVTAATLTFDVLFEADFQWVRGGKLHGLGPTHPVTGGDPRVPSGWSARTMFKAGGSIATYLYDQDLTRKWGRGDNSTHPVFTRDQWHRVTLQVQLNTPDQPDGFSRIFVDCELVVDSPMIVFRGSDTVDTAIQQILFSTFHGGNTPDWTPVDADNKPTTVHARFDNFSVRAGIIAPATTSR